RHLADLLFDAALRLREGLPAEAIELGRALAARVLLDLVEAIDGEEELVAARVLDDQELDGDAADHLALEAEVAADAVIDVDDGVARRERAQVLEERPGRGLSGRGAVRALAEDLLFGDEHEAVRDGDRAAREGRDRDAHRFG